METNNILCEGWIEKRLLSSNLKTLPVDSRWKTRYALLVLKSCKFLELEFYHKKPKTSTGITDDKIILHPWRYTVDLACESKERAHILRIQVYDSGFVTPASVVAKISMQYAEEALAWLRCIQFIAYTLNLTSRPMIIHFFESLLEQLNLTKLTSGIQGHTYSVAACTTPSSQSIGLSEKNCILHIATEAATLALKGDHSVACVWPLSSIRCYTTREPSHFSITSGRRAPLGEGVYDFRTMHGDGDKLFKLMDHYTGITSLVTMLPQAQVTERPPESLQSNPNNHLASDRRESQSKGLFSTDKDEASMPVHVVNARRTSHTLLQRSSPPPKPPRKPLLPKNFSFVPDATDNKEAKEDCEDRTINISVSNPQMSKRPSGVAATSNNVNVNRQTEASKGLYDLDKLLDTLEGNLQMYKTPHETTAANGDDMKAVCAKLSTETKATVVEDESSIAPNPCNNTETLISSAPKPESKVSSKLKSAPKPFLNGSEQAVGDGPSYSTVNFNRKSTKQKK